MKTGKARVVFRNRAVLGQESIWAAEAALCASDQGRFWDYHDKLSASWAGENQGTFAKGNLRRFASDLRLNVQDFDTCLDSGKHSQRVRDETSESNQRGVKGTPSFFVNAVFIEGAQPFDNFKSVIEAQLR